MMVVTWEGEGEEGAVGVRGLVRVRDGVFFECEA